jgi:hypothetical protein
MSASSGSPAGSLFSRLLAWEQAPFTKPVSLTTFGLLVVLGVTIVILWTRVLAHIRVGGGEE